MALGIGNILGFILVRQLAQQDGVQDPAAVNRIALTSLLLPGTMGLVVGAVLAKNEANNQAPPPPASNDGNIATPNVGSVAAPSAGSGGTALLPYMVYVPEFTGRSASDVVQQLKFSYGLQANQQNVISTQPVGIVVSHTPERGSVVQPGSAVTLYVSVGQILPDLTGLLQEDAVQILDEMGLKQHRLHYKPKSSSSLGTVVGQDPNPGDSVNIGQTITLTISGALVPELRLHSEMEAEAEIQLRGLTMAPVKRVASSIVQAGHVTDQNPPANRLVKGDTPVHLTVSK